MWLLVARQEQELCWQQFLLPDKGDASAALDCGRRKMLAGVSGIANFEHALAASIYMRPALYPMAEKITEYRDLIVANTLRGCQLFAGLPPGDLSGIAAITIVKQVDKDEYLFREGEPSRGFYVVQKGAINVHRVNSLGREQVIRVFRTGESFAEATLATATGFPADARATESSQVLVIDKSGFLGLVRRQPELAIRMLASMSVHLRLLVSQLEDLALKDVETRLANWLMKRCPNPESNQPVGIELKTTKRLLAAELGTVSETFSRTLASFRDRKLIVVKGRTLTVLSPSRLRDVLRKNLGE
jgi:CRP/FNR family transcriptional regulator, dissimilatory nitrate respiration regulator